MKTWSMTINGGEADLETCPTALAKTLMPSKKGGKNPLREQASKAASISIDSNHPLPQHLHLVNFLRFFHRIPTPLIEIHIILLPTVITANTLHTPLSLLEATLWLLLQLHLKLVIIETNSPIISTSEQEYTPLWKNS